LRVFICGRGAPGKIQGFFAFRLRRTGYIRKFCARGRISLYIETQRRVDTFRIPDSHHIVAA
jgi:hypothetical protein